MQDGFDRRRLNLEMIDIENAIARDAALDPLTLGICKALAQISQGAMHGYYTRRFPATARRLRPSWS
jgi:hypothetical protein